MNQIIAFTKDWNDVPTCTTHILREMGKTMPVLWINSIGMRRPQFGSRRDVRRMVRKLGSAFHAAEWKENQLKVLSPLVLPKAHSPLARTINRHLLSWAVNRELEADHNHLQREFWTFVPNAIDYAGYLGESKLIYYCVDDWTLFSNIDCRWISRCEEQLLQRANVIFATSRYLKKKCEQIAGREVHYMPHGVDFSKFASALHESTVIPLDLVPLPRPRIGYFGNIRDWIDFPLLKELTLARPAWSFVMIGPVTSDLSELRNLPNLHFLGRREPNQLPAYCKAFDVALIPYRTDDPRMEAINPIKLRELLAAGVPVVASDIPEVRGISQYVRTAKGKDDFLAALEAILSRKLDRTAISEERRTDDWPVRVREIRRIVDAA